VRASRAFIGVLMLGMIAGACGLGAQPAAESMPERPLPTVAPSGESSVVRQPSVTPTTPTSLNAPATTTLVTITTVPPSTTLPPASPTLPADTQSPPRTTIAPVIAQPTTTAPTDRTPKFTDCVIVETENGSECAPDFNELCRLLDGVIMRTERGWECVTNDRPSWEDGPASDQELPGNGLAPPPYQPPTITFPSNWDIMMLDLVNAHRLSEGRAPLRICATLQTAAQRYSEVLREWGQLSHTGPDFSQPTDRARAAGYPAPVGENLFSGPTTVTQAMEGWMNSPGHRNNILLDRYTDVGFGLSYDSNGNNRYWVQKFGVGPGC
jgi:hypothetical protein